jgi:hypothetical protein
MFDFEAAKIHQIVTVIQTAQEMGDMTISAESTLSHKKRAVLIENARSLLQKLELSVDSIGQVYRPIEDDIVCDPIEEGIDPEDDDEVAELDLDSDDNELNGVPEPKIVPDYKPPLAGHTVAPLEGIITIIQTPKKRENSYSNARFSALQDGMTVDAYLQIMLKKYGKKGYRDGRRTLSKGIRRGWLRVSTWFNGE